MDRGALGRVCGVLHDSSLVGHNRVPALQNLQRTELSELRGEPFQRAAVADQPGARELYRQGVGGLEAAAIGGEPRAHVESRQPRLEPAPRTLAAVESGAQQLLEAITLLVDALLRAAD